MFTNAQILEAAQTLRPILPQLLDAESAQSVDHQLTQLLNQTELDENTQVDCILDIVEHHPETKSWLDDFLQTVQTRGYSGLQGNAAPSPATTTFKCPYCDHTDTVPQSGMIPEPCPNHPTVALISV
jgi:hypothetical protein